MDPFLQTSYQFNLLFPCSSLPVTFVQWSTHQINILNANSVNVSVSKTWDKRQGKSKPNNGRTGSLRVRNKNLGISAYTRHNTSQGSSLPREVLTHKTLTIDFESDYCMHVGSTIMTS